MKALVTRFVKDESGATAIEYGLIAAALAIAVVAFMPTFSGALNDLFGRVEADLDASDTVLTPS